MSMSIQEIFLENSHAHTSVSHGYFMIQGQVSDTAIKSIGPVNPKHPFFDLCRKCFQAPEVRVLHSLIISATLTIFSFPSLSSQPCTWLGLKLCPVCVFRQGHDKTLVFIFQVFGCVAKAAKGHLFTGGQELWKYRVGIKKHILYSYVSRDGNQMKAYKDVSVVFCRCPSWDRGN